MTPELEQAIRQIIRQELSFFVGSDRLLFHKSLIELAPGTGTKFGTGVTQKLAFYGKTPVIQQSSVGETGGFTAGGSTGAKVDSTHTGNTGTTAYTVSDVVKHLKTLGLLAS